MNDGLRRAGSVVSRSLFRSAGVGPAAVLTLALGVAGCITVYSFLYDVFLKPLPYKESDRLAQVWVQNVERSWHKVDAAPGNFMDWRQRSQSFTDMAAYSNWPVSRIMTGAGEPYVINVGFVSGNLFSVLGVEPALGRGLSWEETWSNRAPVAVLSHSVWISQFNADPDVIGRHVELNGEAHEVAAVMPSGFFVGPRRNDVWVPYRWAPDALGQDWFRRAHFISVIARLAPGTTLEQAEREMDTIAGQLRAEHPLLNHMMHTGVTPLRDWMTDDLAGSISLVLAAVLLILVIACVNVSGLFLAQGILRQRQFALRAALGASRTRLLWVPISEALSICAMGTSVGLLLGKLTLLGVLGLWPDASLHGVDADLDSGIVFVAVGLVLFCGFSTGLAPALRAGAVAPASLLGSTSGGMSQGSQAALRRGLVGVQLAVTFVLLAVSITAGQGFARLVNKAPGLAAENRIAFQLMLAGPRYDSDEKITQAQREFKVELERIPGVSAVAFISDLPFDLPGWSSDFAIAGRDREDFGIELRHREVSPELFSVLQIPLVHGRGFEGHTPAAVREVVINSAMADRYFPDSSPLGERIAFDRYPDATSVWRTIVGVVDNFRQTGLTGEVVPEAYESLWQSVDSNAHVIVHTTFDPDAMFGAIRESLREFDSQLALESLRPLQSLVHESVTRPRLLTVVLTVFALLASLLTGIGLHGAIMFELNRQRREIGLRQALGARGLHLARSIAAEWSKILSGALLIGLLLGAIIQRPVETWLAEVAAFYWLALLLSAALIAALVATSAWRGGRLAARLPPGDALRAD